MQLHRTACGWTVQAPAKLNLFFEILAKRTDGFHEIETLVTPVDLYDTLSFRAQQDPEIKLTVQRGVGLEAGDVPEGQDNLAVRAMVLLRQRAQVRQGGLLRLVKRIPTAAGLGGGSSDAAAALVLANTAWQLNWTSQQLGQLAAELGSDVPLFFAQGPAICRGRGERVEPLAGVAALDFVLVRPPAGLATVDVYRACRPSEQPQPIEPFLQAWRQGDRTTIGRLLVNRLQPAARTLSPWIARLEAAFSRTDCLGHQMSGSGTCYFGLCRHAHQARRLARSLQAEGLGTAWAVRGSSC